MMESQNNYLKKNFFPRVTVPHKKYFFLLFFCATLCLIPLTTSLKLSVMFPAEGHSFTYPPEQLYMTQSIINLLTSLL